MRRLLSIAAKLAALFAGYIAAVLALRPWFMTWGATDEEIEKPLPGDEIMTRGASSIHAITIEAPRADVWKWLVQIGQDRAGFYSYTPIENGLFRAGIRNADEVVPEWQERKRGDFIRATRPDWMGGRYADRAGWRVADIEPGRHMVLEGWGTFLVRPIDERSCRLIVRSHAPAPPAWLRPLEAIVLEPGHFVMERRMMLRIKALAERTVAREGAVPAISA